MTSSNRLLLDTHIWLNYQGFRKSLRAPVAKAIDDASSRNAVYISVISIWEVAMLVRAGRVQLTVGVEHWSEMALSKPGIRLLPFSPQIAIASVHLPDPMHKDPADRILVASARVEGLTLVTADRKILEFAKSGNLRCLSA